MISMVFILFVMAKDSKRSAISRSKRNGMARKLLWRREDGLILWGQIHIHSGLFFLSKQLGESKCNNNN